MGPAEEIHEGRLQGRIPEDADDLPVIVLPSQLPLLVRKGRPRQGTGKEGPRSQTREHCVQNPGTALSRMSGPDTPSPYLYAPAGEALPSEK